MRVRPNLRPDWWSVFVALACGCASETVASAPPETANGPKPTRDSIWLKPAEGCPKGTVAMTRTCMACDPSGGPAKCLAQCDAGDGAACTFAGTFFDYHVANAPTERAIALVQRGCALGSTDGCMQIASMKMSGKGLVKDEQAAVEIYTGLCERGYGVACRTNVMRRHAGPADRSPSLDEVEVELKRACANGDGVSCRMLTDPYLRRDVREAQWKASSFEIFCTSPAGKSDERCAVPAP